MPVDAAVQRSTRYLSGAADVRLAVHTWEPANGSARGTAFYIHGIQSHAGWLHETGPQLAARGITVTALDRRGSGESGGARGDLESADAVFDDYRRAFDQIDEAGPVVAVGQSFGGSVMAGLLVNDLIAPDRVVFCAPALGQQRLRHDADALAAIRGDKTGERVFLGFTDDQYTTDSVHLRWIANDPLMIRSITARTRATMVEIEDTYWDADDVVSDAILVHPRTDSIIDTAAAGHVLQRLSGAVHRVVLPTDAHYIEFSEARDDYLAIIAGALEQV
ncbi:MAG: alpha/beta fold hydrolase [Gordonia sp. (in: high G+C Gram-positive bacteria)]